MKRKRPARPKRKPARAAIGAGLDALVADAARAGLPSLTPLPRRFAGLSSGERRVLRLLAERSAKRCASAKAPPKPARGTGPAKQPVPPMAVVSAGVSGIPHIDGIGEMRRPTAETELRLPNARVREPYSAPLADITAASLTGDSAGFVIDADGHLVGTPDTAGDLTLHLEGQRGETPVKLIVRITVIPDPRDLWTSTPSDRQAPFWKPDTAFDSRIGNAFLIGASKRGRSHARDGGFREDHVEIHAEPGGWHLIAVADGAGSAEFSREGSRVACARAIAVLKSQLDDTHAEKLATQLASTQGIPNAVRTEALYPVLGRAALEAAKAVASKAAEAGRTADAYATTLLCAIARRFGPEWFVATITVGDGGAVLYDAGAGTAEVLCAPDGGEFAGETRFLDISEFRDGHAILSRIFCARRTNFSVLAVMTDGITDPLFPTAAALGDPDTWAKFWRDDLGAAVSLDPGNAMLETQMLDWLDFWSKGNHDDRTLALLIPEGRP
ncbi:MAG: PP2C family serine/threonine-protein phosphatase [Pseudomonadota bacterium]